MDEEQALQFARNAAEKAMAGMKTEASVRMRLKDEVPTVLESKIGGMPYFPAGAAIPPVVTASAAARISASMTPVKRMKCSRDMTSSCCSCRAISAG